MGKSMSIQEKLVHQPMHLSTQSGQSLEKSFKQREGELSSPILSSSTSEVVSQLDKNLGLAHKINDYTQEKVPIILNYLERCKIDYAAEREQSGYQLDMESFHGIVSMLFEMAYTPVACAEFTTKNIQKIATVAKKYGVGTWLEMSAVAFDYCLENRVSQPAELFYLEGGNHVFLVIGRDPKSVASN